MNRKIIEEHGPSLPSIRIDFLYNKAVVTYKTDWPRDKFPGYVFVEYGFMFYWRLKSAIKKVCKKFIIEKEKNGN